MSPAPLAAVPPPTISAPAISPRPLVDDAPVPVTERATANAAAFSTATPADIQASTGELDALVGTKLITASFVDPSLQVGDLGRTADVPMTAAASMAPGALFDALPDAIAVSQRAAKDLAGTVGLPADGLAPGQVIVKVGDRFAALMASINSAAPHPIVAEYEPSGAGNGWKTLAASSYTPVNDSVAAVIDGLGNLVPLAE